MDNSGHELSSGMEWCQFGRQFHGRYLGAEVEFMVKAGPRYLLVMMAPYKKQGKRRSAVRRHLVDGSKLRTSKKKRTYVEMDRARSLKIMG